MSKRFYLETSIIRSRLFGHSDIREPLKDKLKQQILITSKFVQMEFSRNFICNLIEFYFVLKNEKSIDDAIKYWNEEYKIRKIKDINFAIADIFCEIQDNNDIPRALLNLRNQIKIILISFNCLIRRFDKNGTNCFLANIKLDFESYKTVEEIEEAFSKFYKVFKENHIDQCKIINLFKSSGLTLNKIKNYNSENNGFIDQKNNLKNISNGNKKLSCQTCKTIGDTIRALECPDYAILLSLDKIFEDLCNILDLKFEIIDSVRKKIPISEKLKDL